MKINKKVEVIIVAVLYLVCLYFWTLPIQNIDSPYGEVDAASHYGIADYTIEQDKSISYIPYFLDRRYGNDNRFEPHTLWYPPPFHMVLAIGAYFGGDTTQGIFIANTIMCSIFVLSIYFVIRKLFGFEIALVSSFFLIFSLRDIMIFLWGQWPERLGFAYVPLVLYCFYKYCDSYLKKEEKPVYIYLTAILLAINLFIHPMVVFHSIGGIMVLFVLLLIKERKLFFSFKHAIFAILLFVVVLGMFPSQVMNVVIRTQNEPDLFGGKGDYSRLFSWFKPQEDNYGVPQSYFSFKEMVAPYWAIIFLLIGIIFLFLRRKRKDLLMLAWLISLYVMTHIDVIGKGRVHRSLSGTAHIFYPLMVIGLVYLVSFVAPRVKEYKGWVKVLGLALFAVFLGMAIIPSSYKQLDEAYPAITRLNEDQIQASEWMKENINPGSTLFHQGSISLAKTRWFRTVSQRYLVNDDFENRIGNITHMIIDYSDFARIGEQNALNGLRAWEIQNYGNKTPVYNSELIRVYEFEN